MIMQIDTKELMTPEQVACVLEVSTNTIHKHLSRGVITGIKFGASWLITKKELRRFQKERRPRGRPPKKA